MHLSQCEASQPFTFLKIIFFILMVLPSFNETQNIVDYKIPSICLTKTKTSHPKITLLKKSHLPGLNLLTTGKNIVQIKIRI